MAPIKFPSCYPRQRLKSPLSIWHALTKEWEERYNAKRKAQVEAAKAAIRAEDMEKGIFIPVGQLPRQEPRKATVSASAAV